MNLKIKRLFIVAGLTCLIIALLAPGCGSPKSETTTPEEKPTGGSAPSTPVNVDLSISYAPALNAPAELTLTILSRRDAPNTNAQIILPSGAALLSGSLTWQGNLKAGESVSFSAEIVFKEVGKWAIEGVARYVIDEKNSWGDIDVIYLTVGVDSGAFGWPPIGPVKIEQVENGDVEGVESSQEEPPIEDLPEPPAAPAPKRE